ncbi:MAG TPA: dihydrodipicolinate synthase family protein [Cyclobacteriaceae bacterium]|nr:dihydrodipicolinate synthase family protein [Cyclobacteriaceae bacterium]
MRENLKGVWPAMLTPMDENGRPNWGELEKITDLLISQGLDGLYLLGSTGQGFLLSTEDRMKVAEVVSGVNAGRVPLIVQVGSLTTHTSVQLAKQAETCRVDGISSVAPIYYGPSDGTSSMAMKHYTDIASATGLPFFPYQLGSGGYLGGITGFVEKLIQIPNMAGMKLTTNNLLEISTISYTSQNKLVLFSGSDELMCQAALCGTSGAIGTFYNLFGQECQKVRAAFLEGQVQLASDFMLVFQEMIAEVLPNVWTFLRQAMQLRYGVNIGRPVAPLGNTHKTLEEQRVLAMMDKVIKAAK